jgi:hypothetical protein
MLGPFGSRKKRGPLYSKEAIFSLYEPASEDVPVKNEPEKNVETNDTATTNQVPVGFDYVFACY